MDVFASAVFLTMTAFLQDPEPPEAVLPLQAAAAAIWRDCQAKSNAEKRSKPPLRRFRPRWQNHLVCQLWRVELSTYQSEDEDFNGLKVLIDTVCNGRR